MKIYIQILPVLMFLGGCAPQSPGPSSEAIYYQQLAEQKKADSHRLELDTLKKELSDLKRRAGVSPPQNRGTSVYIIGSDVSGPLLSAGAVGGRVQTEQVRQVTIKRPPTRSPVVQRPKTTGELVAGPINNFVDRAAGLAPAAISQVAEVPMNYIEDDDNAGLYTDQSSVVTSEPEVIE
jgi:hypothetical protein